MRAVTTTGASYVCLPPHLIPALTRAWTFLFRFDDAFDVIAMHFVGGVMGTLLLGFFAEDAVNAAGANGVFFGGGARFLGDQALAAVVVGAYSFGLTWVIATAVEATMGLRTAPADQVRLDQCQQGIDAYHLDRVSSLVGAIERRGATGIGALDGGGLPRATVCGTYALVTGLVESGEADELVQALLDAGDSRSSSTRHTSTRDGRRPRWPAHLGDSWSSATVFVSRCWSPSRP
jgi:hypothetical protein